MTRHATYSARFPLAVGLLALVLLVGVFGVWSVRAQIAGAIISSGMIVVENNRQVVQHPEGGIVRGIAVRDGARVEVGDLLVELDDSLLRSELQIAELQIIELRARRARLEAERDEASTLRFPKDLLAEGSDAANQQIEGQRVLFLARKDTFEKEVSQVGERILQTRNQIFGAEAQLASLKQLEMLSSEELAVQENALTRGLTQSARVLSLRREVASLAGQIGQVQSDIARFHGEIASLEIERVRVRNARREDAISQLRDIQFRELELIEQRKSILKRLERLDMRAPVSGIIYGSTVFARNAVIRAAEPVMFVVPQDQPLIVSARVDAIHIDQLRIGQPAALRFTAFNQRLTPEILARVSIISADVIEDQTTGRAYYSVEVIPEEAEITKLEGLELLPGMPVEVFIRTVDRTPLSYLTKPLTDYFGRAFRES